MAIQLFKCKIHEESIENVNKVLRSGWTALGPTVAKFEEEFAKYVNAPYAVAFNSCTEALRASVVLANLPKDSYVISTPLTFVSTNHAILYAGLQPVFADIDFFTGNISADSISDILSNDEDIGPKVSAIMVVHYGGSPVDLDMIYNLAETYGIPIIEDAAHACGAEYRGNKIGCHWSTYTNFSFHAVKNMPTGDGGMLTTNDQEIAERAKQLRWLGINKSTADRTSGTLYSWKYDCNVLGFKSGMNDITAAIGLGQLKYIDEDNAYRGKLVELYETSLRGANERLGFEYVSPLLRLFDTKSSHHLMAVTFKNSKYRDKVMIKLKENDIQFGMHYTPNYMYPMYWSCYKEDGCKNVESFYRRALTLPLHLELEEEDVIKICNVIENTAKDN